MIDRIKVYEKYGGRCAYCGIKIQRNQMEVDHIFPKFYSHFLRSKEMKKQYKLTINNINDFDNLNPSCRVCNRYKASFFIEEFRHHLEQQQKRAFKSSLNYRLLLKYGLIIENEPKVTFYFERIGNENKEF
jgi:5-methylcytosine-specific restriction endonuclease McrA